MRSKSRVYWTFDVSIGSIMGPWSGSWVSVRIDLDASCNWVEIEVACLARTGTGRARHEETRHGYVFGMV